jgi:creatinine amidohydrolase
MSSVWLHHQKWKDIETYLKSKKTIIVPVGSVEQHGHHLPLGTDSLVAIKVAEDVAKQAGILSASPLYFGWAPHHMAFPGTVTLRPETLMNVVKDVCQSLIYHGFEKIIVLNGHREANLPPLKMALTKLRNETGAFLALADPFYIADQIGREIRESEPGGVGHAAEMETSHMMFLHPELCEMDKAVKNISEKHRFLNHDPFVKGDKVFVPSDIGNYRKSSGNIGVIGDPTASKAENGQVYHEALVRNLVELVHYCEEEVEVTLRKQEIPL